MNLFLQVNLLLCVTGCLVVLLEKFIRAARIDVSFVRTLRLTQIMFLGSLSLPIVLKLLPSASISGVQSRTLTAYADRMSQPLSLPKVNVQEATQVTAAPVSPIQAVELDYANLVLIAWLIGVIWCLTLFLSNYLDVRRLLSSTTLIRSYRRIRIVASAEIFVPFSIKTPRHLWVVIPETLLTADQDRELAIKHELQHHRQGDPGWAILLELARCGFFMNPAIYLWKNIITEYQELACDEALIGRKEISSQAYGSCLLRVAEAALHHRHLYVGTTSMAAIIKDSNYFKKFLLRRIEMITERRSTRTSWMTVTASVLVLGVSVATAVGAEKLVRGSRTVNPGVVGVDPQIQKIADDALARALARTKATAGFIIVAEPSSGKVLAVANRDLKTSRKGHWSLGELMESGSIAKPIMVAEAIELGKTNLSSKHDCENGTFSFHGTTYRDWKDGGWSSLSTTEAIELSSNICSLKIGQLVGEKQLLSMLEKFGFGTDGTARSFPESRPGERPQPGTQIIPQVSIGLGFKSSALEILQAYGAIANGGKLMDPVSHKALRQVLSPKSAKETRELLHNVVLRGTGMKAQSDLYSMAGKTATVHNSEFIDGSGYVSKTIANQASFIGFAPLKNPKVEVFVGIINPNTDQTGAHGGAHAAPVFREVAENVLTHLKVAPDKM